MLLEISFCSQYIIYSNHTHSNSVYSLKLIDNSWMACWFPDFMEEMLLWLRLTKGEVLLIFEMFFTEYLVFFDSHGCLDV